MPGQKLFAPRLGPSKKRGGLAPLFNPRLSITPPFAATSDVKWGFENQAFQPPARTNPQHYAGTKSKSGFAFPNRFFPLGWEIQAVQPPPPLFERAAALARGDDGLGNPAAPPTVVGWFDPALPQPLKTRPAVPQRYSGIKGKSAFVAFPWQN